MVTMVELKTLNDFGKYDGIHSVDKRELKQEVMKQLDYKFKMAMNEKNEGIKEFLLGQCSFIEEFFDLEDLE